MDQDFNEWYNKSLKQCNEAYNSVSSYCHNYVYNKLSNPPRTDELNDLIDNAFKYRLGLIDEKPRANDKSINEILESLIYGNKLPSALISKFYEALEKNVTESSVRHEFKRALRSAIEPYYDRL